MPMTMEEFDAMEEHKDLPFMERQQLLRMYGLPLEVTRHVVVNDNGKVIKKTGVGRGVKIVQAEQEAAVDEAPDPPKYFNGKFRFMPVGECGVMANYLKFITAEYPRLFLKAVCATCHVELIRECRDDENPVDKIKVLGVASDHTRTTVNHAVYVLDEEMGLYLYRSPYRILSTCSK